MAIVAEKNGYLSGQIEKAEWMARLLESISSEERDFIVMLGNAFISGLEVGMQADKLEK